MSPYIAWIALSIVLTARTVEPAQAVHVQWQFETNRSPAPVQFTLYRSEDDGATWTVLHPAVPLTTREYRDTALQYARRYCYQISVRYPALTQKRSGQKKDWQPPLRESSPIQLGCVATMLEPPLAPVTGGSALIEEVMP